MAMTKEVACLIGHEFALNANGEKQHPQVTLKFRVEGGPRDGQTFEYGPKSLTEGTKPQVRNAYLAMGWTGKGNPAKMGHEHFARTVEIAIDLEEWETDKGKASALRVQFVNPLLRTNGPILSLAERDRLAGFFGDDAQQDDGGGYSDEDGPRGGGVPQTKAGPPPWRRPEGTAARR